MMEKTKESIIVLIEETNDFPIYYYAQEFKHTFSEPLDKYYRGSIHGFDLISFEEMFENRGMLHPGESLENAIQNKFGDAATKLVRNLLNETIFLAYLPDDVYTGSYFNGKCDVRILYDIPTIKAKVGIVSATVLGQGENAWHVHKNSTGKFVTSHVTSSQLIAEFKRKRDAIELAKWAITNIEMPKTGEGSLTEITQQKFMVKLGRK